MRPIVPTAYKAVNELFVDLKWRLWRIGVMEQDFKTLARKAAQALDDWIAIHAGVENCGELAVAEASKRIMDGGGTFLYAGNIRDELLKVANDFKFLPQDKKRQIKAPVISIDRESRTIAILDEFELVTPFVPYADELHAIQMAKDWIKLNTGTEPTIVFPKITKMRIG